MAQVGARGQKLAYLFAPLLLVCAVGTALLLKHYQPLQIFGIVTGAILLLSILWIGISTLWPPHADRTCPSCGSEGLLRLDKTSTVGVRCGDCSWVDRDQSSWLLAEEEGPLEEIVLSQRKKKSGTARLDTGTSSD